MEQSFCIQGNYIHYGKAFDKVDHHILIKKLQSLNIPGKILSWIKNFLTNREQSVRVENSLSDPVSVKSGVPQGSVLGPLLFLVMMIDINKDVYNAIIGTFADDTRLWNFITQPHDEINLQNDLDKIYNWADENNMSFNEKKLEGLRFGKINNRPTYKTSNDSIIDIKENVKDLGGYISQNLKFDYHIKNIVAKGNKMAGWALRTFKTRNVLTMLTLLKSIVISQVEYCCPLWSPMDAYNINLLESVQRNFTSKISVFQTYDMTLKMPICTVSYPERLKRLKIYSLQRRRERYIIMYMYKIVIDMVPNPGFQIDYTRNKIIITPKQKLGAKDWIQTIRRNSFFSVGPRLYNSLPQYLRELEDIHTPEKKHTMSFKRRLDKYLVTIPDVPGPKENSLLRN